MRRALRSKAVVQLPQGNWTQKDELGGGSSQPLFLGCQKLTGALGLAQPATC